MVPSRRRWVAGQPRLATNVVKVTLTDLLEVKNICAHNISKNIYKSLKNFVSILNKVLSRKHLSI